jgi:FkbM family methyltransferase
MRVSDPVKKFIKNHRPLYRSINRLRGIRIHEPTVNTAFELIGSAYGGWAIDVTKIGPTSTVYAVGVGEDITFDVGLIDRTGCEVHSFDPTPIAVEYMSAQALPTRLHFHPIGLGAADESAQFQIPPVPGWHSYSLAAEQGAVQRGTITCEIRRLSSLMRQLGHVHIDALKMDIEGFEYPVIAEIIASGIRPTQLLVEFHHGFYSHTSAQTKCAVDALLHVGYSLYWVSDVGREYGFLYSK